MKRQMKTNYILNGDALAHLKEFESESINMVMTSPPYWALRDYGIKGQIGLEATFEEYINNLCNIFDEIKRVLRKDGTVWINLGDTYWGGGQGGSDYGGKETTPEAKYGKKAIGKNYQAKSLVAIPFRFAIEMVNRGWILRNTIIWHKPNAMPDSTKDRFTVDFEYLFLFSKEKKYYFEQQFEAFVNEKDVIYRRRIRQLKVYNVKEPYKNNLPYTKIRGHKVKGEDTLLNPQHHGKDIVDYEEGRNKRTTWIISTEKFAEAHFAVYPEELCETPIKAGCPEGGIVFDPFFGAGTTGVVALKQKKKFIGIELNPEYILIAKARLKPLLEQEVLEV